MPANTVKVDRTTRWGNPFRVGQCGPFGRQPIDAEGAVGFFSDMLRDDQMRATARYPFDLRPLSGKNLACWCPIGSPCHADVLLKMANDQAPVEGRDKRR